MRTRRQLLMVFAALILPASSCPNTCFVASNPCDCDYYTLRCSERGFSDFSAFGVCTGVDRIFLNGNTITELKTGNFTAFLDAQYIDLRSNKIANIEKEVFSDTPKLTELLLDGNELKVLPTLNLAELTVLRIQNNPLSSFQGILAPKLEELALAGCKLSTFNDFLTTTSKLNKLDLSNNKLTELNSEWFQNAPSLTILDVSHNEVKSLRFVDDSLKNLISLDLSYNDVLKDLDTDLFKSVPGLQTLNLERTSLSAQTDGPLLSHPSLTSLTLASCGFTKQLPAAAFSELPQLQQLDLSDNTLFEVERLFDSSAALRVLILSGNGLQFLPSDVFAGTPKLEELYLNDNNALYSINISTIEHLSSLRFLDVSNTRLSCDCSEEHWLLDRWTNETGIEFKNICGAQPSCDWDKIITTTERAVKCWDAAGYCSGGEKCCPTGVCAVKCRGAAVSALPLTLIMLLGVIITHIDRFK